MPCHFRYLPATLRVVSAHGEALSVARVQPATPSRLACETFIAERFRCVHGAQISQFMPELFAVTDADGALHAIAGARLAASAALFLEQYLDVPIERLVSERMQGLVRRSSIVEIGNLAAVDTGSARLSIVALTYLLASAGLEWVTFTGAATLTNSFHRLGLEPQALCLADPLRLGEQRHAWGRYYQQQPQVQVGNIRAGFTHLREAGIFARLGLDAEGGQVSHVA
ncbi:thermostable hemolysin [Pseudomonas cremoricolorata]|uniref:thermostable hemolysin n=1 Tax=Pseudomonas cremoricolorata TaxID=157783 RepID=UPI000423C524|nr:thermostable hemolysin [Pseudomonas cremoricolorata]